MHNLFQSLKLVKLVINTLCWLFSKIISIVVILLCCSSIGTIIKKKPFYRPKNIFPNLKLWNIFACICMHISNIQRFLKRKGDFM